MKRRDLFICGLFAAGVLFSLGGCSLTPIALGSRVEGTLSFSDSRSGPDRNGWYFYYDTYSIPVEAGRTYEVQLWSYDGESIWFEGDVEDDIDYSWDYKVFTFTAEPGAGEYYIYTRGDNLLDGDIEYAFIVSEN